MIDRPQEPTAKDYLDIVDDGPALTDIKSLGSGPGHMTDKSDQPLEFTFDYQGFLFAAKAERSDDGDVVHFHANLGRVPYSAQSKFHRANAIAIVNAASKVLKGRMKLSGQQRIMLIHKQKTQGRLTPNSLMVAVVELIIMSKPFLYLLSSSVELPTRTKQAFSKAKVSSLGQVSPRMNR